MRVVGRAALRLHEIPKPTIAAVNGVAVGAGCNLALGCDLIVAADTARFSEIFARRGLNLDFGGSWLLPRLVGMHKAKELAFLADVISADEAERYGIVNRVVPADDLMKVVGELAHRIAAQPPVQISITKKLLDQSFSVSMAEALEFEDVAQSLAFSLARHRRGDARLHREARAEVHGRVAAELSPWPDRALRAVDPAVAVELGDRDGTSARVERGPARELIRRRGLASQRRAAPRPRRASVRGVVVPRRCSASPRSTARARRARRPSRRVGARRRR